VVVACPAVVPACRRLLPAAAADDVDPVVGRGVVDVVVVVVGQLVQPGPYPK
jgi:hypothetical protein